jgi:cell fate (sporulation/competence/biofilm development) regulator YlbF (YheA/YmcA/DUF963 family)
MPDDIQSIIDKAKMLSSSIRNHAVTLRYNECRNRMGNDRSAQELYANLVALGKELNETISSGGTAEPQRTAEYELLQRKLEQNPLVKEYIQSQKEYLELLKKVIEKIKNPR